MKRALRVAIVLGTCVTTFVACFGKPGDPGGSNGNRDGGVDAKEFLDAHLDAPVDAPKVFMDAKMFMDAPGEAGMCGSAHDDFTDMSGSACGSWGMGSNTQWMSRVTGYLRMTPQNASGAASCSATIKFAANIGTQIEVQEADLFFMGDRTYFSVGDGGAQFAQLQFQHLTNDNVSTSCSGTSTATGHVYNSTNDKWIRLRPVASTVVFETGSNGVDWNSLGACSWSSMPATVTVTFGTQAGMASGGSAVFDDFNEHPCTPP